MTNQKVSFIELTQQEYDDSMKHSDAAFYYTSDTHKFYKGDNEIGAGGSSNDFVITYTIGDDDLITADKTNNEITAAIEAGETIKVIYENSSFILSSAKSNMGVQLSAFRIRYVNKDGGKISYVELHHTTSYGQTHIIVNEYRIDCTLYESVGS